MANTQGGGNSGWQRRFGRSRRRLVRAVAALLLLSGILVVGPLASPVRAWVPPIQEAGIWASLPYSLVKKDLFSTSGNFQTCTQVSIFTVAPDDTIAMDGGRRGIHFSNLQFPRSPHYYTPLDVQSSAPRNFFGSVADSWPGAIFLDGRLGRTVGHSTTTLQIGNPNFADACNRGREIVDSFGEAFLQEYTFWKEVNRVDPIVSFRTERVPGKPLTLRFLGSASHPGLPGGAFSYSWTNLVGTARPFIGQGMNFEYTFPAAGEYEIGVVASYPFVGGGQYSLKVNVGDQGIVGELFNRSTAQGSTIKQGEKADIRLRLENQGDAALTDVRVDLVAVVATDTDGKGAATFTPSTAADARRLRGALDTTGEGIRDFADYDLNPTAAGTVRISVNVSGKKPDGTAETAVITWDVTIRPTPLSVELTARVTGGPVRTPGQPLQFVLNENKHKNKFFVDMKFTNTEDKEITQVRFPDPAEPIGLSTRRKDADGMPIPGVSLKLLTKPLPTLNGFTLEAKGTRTLSFEYEAFDVTDAELSARITGVLEGQAISGRGTVDVKVASDVLIEFGIKLDSRTEGYISGQPVKAIGVLENVSEDARIGVIVYPTTEENAGNANVFRNVGGKTPTSPQGFMLNPGEPALQIGAVLKTLEMPVASDAVASWEVHAWRHETDPETGELVKIPIPSTQIKILDTEGYSNAVRVRLLPAETPVRAFDCGYRYFNCGLVVGLSNFAESSYDFVRFGLSSIGDLRAAMFRLFGFTFRLLGDAAEVLAGDEQAKARLVAEITVDVEAAIEAGRFTFTEGSPVIDAVGASLDQSLRKWDQINRTGDLEQMEFELGRIAGENPDAVFEVVVAGIAARKALIGFQGADNVIRGSLERAAVKREVSLPDRLAAAERSGVPIPKSGAFAAGDTLTLAQIAKYWGASMEDVRNLFKIADAENISLTFRSRSAEAIALIRNKISWPKPQFIKIKSINELDIQFLGYRKSRSGRVEIVEPPLDLDIDYSLPKEQLAAKAKTEAAAWVARNHGGLDADTAAQLAERLQTRMEEWPTALEKYINPARNKNGKLLTRKTGPNRIERDIEIGFEYDAQGVDGSVAKNLKDKRTMRVTQIVDEAGVVRPDPTRRYFEVEMAGPDGSDFRSITGDIDFISILNVDGSFIGTSRAAQAKRVRIYGYLQKMLGMQHGESFSFIYGGRAGYLQEVAEGVESAVTISPGSKAHAANFVQNVSITVDSPNVGKRAANPTGDWILMAGHPYDWVAKVDLFNVITLNSLTDTLRRFYNLPLFFLPGQLYRYIDGLTEDGISDRFDGDGGAPLRPDDDGGTETYQPAGSASASKGTQSAAVSNANESPEIGRWVPISLADALKLGPNPKKLELVPMTQLSEGADAGQTRVAVLEASRMGMSPSSPWFQPGDEVVIDPGEFNEERVKVSALGSLIFEQPLARSHSEGATVMLFRRQPGGNTGPTTIATTTTLAASTTTTTLFSSGPATGNSIVPVIVPDPTSSVTTSPTTAPSSSAAPSASTTTPPSPEGTGLIVNVPVAPAAIDVTVQANQPLAYTGDDVRLPIIIALMAILFGYLLRRRTKRIV